MTRSLPRRMLSGAMAVLTTERYRGQQPAVRGADAEVALVALGDLEDDALGELEELVAVAAGDDLRLLDEGEVLVDEEVVLDEVRRPPPWRRRRGARA